MAKLTLRVPSFGKKPGDTIDVSDKDLADELVRNGTARKAQAEKKSDSKG